MDVLSDVSLLKGVGEKTKLALNESGVFTIKDLLLNLPKRYKVYKSVDLKNINDNDLIIISGKILSFVVTKFHFNKFFVYD